MARITPPRPPPSRGDPKEPASVKLFGPLKAYIAELKAEKYNISEVMNGLGTFALEALTRADSVRFLLEQEAKDRGITLGEAAGEILTECLRESWRKSKESQTKR